TSVQFWYSSSQSLREYRLLSRACSSLQCLPGPWFLLLRLGPAVTNGSGRPSFCGFWAQRKNSWSVLSALSCRALVLSLGCWLLLVLRWRHGPWRNGCSNLT